MRLPDRLRSPTTIVTGLCLLGFGLRILRLDFHPIWFDEDLAYQRATASLEISLASMAGSPLYYILLRGWVELAGASLFALRYLSAFFGVLGIPFIYLVISRLLGSQAALATTVVAVLAPFYIYYSQEARTYAFTLTLVLLSMYAFVRWLDTRKGWALAICCLANLVCLYTHYVAGLVIAAQGVILLLAPSIRWKDTLAFSAVHVGVGLAFLPWLFRVAGQLPRVIAPPDSTAVDAWSVLGRTWTEFSVGRTIPPPLSLYLAAVPLFLALAGLFTLFSPTPRRSSRRRQKRSDGDQAAILTHERFTRTLLLVWLIAPIVGSLLAPRASVRFSPKYLIAITPVYYALMVLGLAALRKESRTLFWVAVALLICVSLYGLGEYYLRPHDKLARIQDQAIAQASAAPAEDTLSQPVQHILNNNRKLGIDISLIVMYNKT